MPSRILPATALSLACSLSAPLVRAHVGEHAGTGPAESLVHLLGSADHWLALPLLLVGALALYRLPKVRCRF
jgi:hypothetical protein